MTKNTMELIGMIRNAKNPAQAIARAYEILELIKIFGDDFLNGSRCFINTQDSKGFLDIKGFLAYTEEWKDRLKEQTN